MKDITEFVLEVQVKYNYRQKIITYDMIYNLLSWINSIEISVDNWSASLALKHVEFNESSILE